MSAWSKTNNWFWPLVYVSRYGDLFVEDLGGDLSVEDLEKDLISEGVGDGPHW